MSTPHRRRKDQEPSMSNAVDIVAIEPIHEDIARRAFQLFEERGGEHGRDLEDWLQAERELRQFLHGAVGKFLAAEGTYAAA